MPLCKGALSFRSPATHRADRIASVRLLVPSRRSEPVKLMAGDAQVHLRSEPMLLTVEHLVVEYGVAGQRVHAVSDISFDLKRGETLGLVGESGCGKSSLARAVLQLSRPTAGKVVFDGIELTRLTGERLRQLRRR